MHPNLEHEIKQRIAECPTSYPMPTNEEELARFLRWSRRRQFQIRDQLYVVLWYGQVWVRLSGVTLASYEGDTVAPTPEEINRLRPPRHHITQEEWDRVRQTTADMSLGG